jgi:vacuolar-type H+-ATPase subunit H
MKPQTALALVLVAVFGLVGCSTKPAIFEIALNTAAPAGVPFRMTTDKEVLVYRLNDEANTYTLVAKGQQRLADTTKLFVINYEGMVFASNSLKVSQNPDNTMKSMQVTSVDSTASTIDAASSAISSFRNAETAQKNAAVTAAKAVADADKAVRDAQKDLDGLPSSTSAETRALYEKLLESAKQQAAMARAAAGS